MMPRPEMASSKVSIALILACAGLLIATLACPPSLPASTCDSDDDCPLCSSCDIKLGFCYDSQMCTGGSCQAGHCCAGCWQDGVCMPGDQPQACGSAGSVCAPCSDGQPCESGICGPPAARGLASSAGATCRVREDGSLWCHGNANGGVLGVGMRFGATLIPRRVLRQAELGPLEDVVAVRGFASNLCAKTAENKLYCWGIGDSGQIGNGAEDDAALATLVTDDSGQAFQAFLDFDVGNGHVCALGVSGEVWCWGNNGDGQLGLGAGAASKILRPQAMRDASGTIVHSVVAVSCGDNHTCLLMPDGSLRCAGKNRDGQLGDGSTRDRDIAVTVQETGGEPLQGAVEVAAGYHHSCARLAGGGLRCWGAGSMGELGNGQRDRQEQAVAVLDIQDAVALSLSYQFSCALTQQGIVRCWGQGMEGQLGDGGDNSRSQPSALYFDGAQPSPSFVLLSAGFSHACAVDSHGALWCWGSNSRAQLGVDVLAYSRSLTPLRAHVLPGTLCAARPAQDLATGAAHSCAVDSQAQTWCWGDNGGGLLGTGLIGFQSNLGQPTVLQEGGSLGPPLIDVFSGPLASHSCGRDVEHRAWCWGQGRYGRLGVSANQPDASSDVPLKVKASDGTSFAPVRQMSAGQFHTCAIVDDDGAAVWCWGDDQRDQLGNGPGSGSQQHPVLVLRDASRPLDGARQIASGRSFGCALLASDEVMCWGEGRNGQIGNGAWDNQEYAVAVVDAQDQPLADVTAISAGASHACAADSSSVIWCWGINSDGQLGSDAGTHSSQAVRVDGQATGVLQLALGGQHSCALSSAGQVWCWGNNDFGQLGDATTRSRYLPSAVLDAEGQALVDVVQIVAGKNSTCLRRQGGQVLCFGDNGSGQIGQAAATPFASRPRVVDLGCR